MTAGQRGLYCTVLILHCIYRAQDAAGLLMDGKTKLQNVAKVTP